MTPHAVGEAPSGVDVVLTGPTVMSRLRLDGRVALVTGAGQGIGRAFAHALGEAGASVAVIDRELDRAEAVTAELEAKGIPGFAIGADVTDPQQIDSAVSNTARTFGGLHIAVNNAGVNLNGAAEDMPLSDWDLVFALNSRAVFHSCQLEAKIMFAQGYGKIVNTASMASLIVPHPQKQVAYNASKASVVHLTRTLAAEWADRGIRVNCVSPGIIRTALIESNPALQPLVSRWLPTIPLGRLGESSDLQGGIVYLASSASDYLTGHNLVIEGGQTLW